MLMLEVGAVGSAITRQTSGLKLRLRLRLRLEGRGEWTMTTLDKKACDGSVW